MERKTYYVTHIPVLTLYEQPAYHMRLNHEIEPRGIGGILIRCPLGIG